MKALTHIRRRGLRSARREEGQALVELALCMPLLLILVMAIIQFGIMLSDYSTLVDAARSGARELSLGRNLSDPCDLAVSQTMTSTAGSMSIPSGDITPSFTAASSSSPDYCGTGTTCNFVYKTSCNANGNEEQGDEAKITIQYPYTLSVFGLGVLHLNLSTSASDAIE